jgi:enoyl-CoA hydratase/carnithine racemase
VAAEEALSDEALDLAREIAANAPIAQRGNKRVIRAVLTAGEALDAATEAELIGLRQACFSSEDFREAVRAFAEKRTPVWRDR